jgi:hypothetical protein
MGVHLLKPLIQGLVFLGDHSAAATPSVRPSMLLYIRHAEFPAKR